MTEVHWSEGRSALDLVRLVELARQEARLRVLERHLEADARAYGWPPMVLARFDQWAAAERVRLGIPLRPV